MTEGAAQTAPRVRPARAPRSDGPGLPVRLATLAAMLGMILLLLMVLAFALPVLGHSGHAPFSWVWLPSQGQFGILPMFAGSLLLAGSALLLGWPLALGLSVWLLAVGKGRPLTLVSGMVRFMTAIPTVVYGFAAVFLLTPLVRDALGGTGLGWFSAAVILSLLILPTMILVLDAGLRARLDALCPEGLAVGFSRLELLCLFVLPQAKKNLISTAMLGFGRAVGDTLIPLMLAGNAPQVPEHLSESLRTLTAHMALVTANEVGGAAYDSLFLAGVLLLGVNMAVSLGLARMTTPRDAQADSIPSGGRMLRLRCPLLRVLAWLGLFCTVGLVAALMFFLLWRGAPALSLSLLFGDTPPWQAVLGLAPVWDGLWPACVGTLCLVGLTLLLALVPGVGCGVYLAQYATPRQRRIMGCAVDMLAGTPSIVMGLFGFSLILFLRRTLWPDANTGLLLAAGCLALLVLPVLIVTTREALDAVPEDLRLSAAALGFTRRQMLRHIQLPAAARGIAGGVVLAVGRAAEDTAVIMLTGVVANAGLPAGLGAKFEALPFAIYYTAAQYQTPEELGRGFGAALLLLLLAGMLLLAARRLVGGG